MDTNSTGIDLPTLSTQLAVLVQGVLVVIGALIAIFGGKK